MKYRNPAEQLEYDQITHGNHAPVLLSDDELRIELAKMLEISETDKKENALAHWQPNPQSMDILRSKARVIGIGGGNGSGKTENGIIRMLILATGIIPDSIRADPETYMAVRARMRGPIKCRLVCESLTTTLHNVILEKLKWWLWTGVDEPGGERGHYGWIPRTSLIKEDWQASWSEKLRTLRIYYRNPDNPAEILGESTIQFMSHDQDPTDFASGDYHIVMMDEPPRYAIWTENEARTMRVRGEMYLCMTWPDDPAIPVDWIFDVVYEKAHGPNKIDDIDWFNLWTTNNPHLDQVAIAAQMEKWSEATSSVRIFGQPIRFSNRIHPLFTDQETTWCFSCGKPVFLTLSGPCSCGSTDIVNYCHVSEVEASPYFPTIFVIDPHPRKPHMMAWIQVSPYDDLFQVKELLCDGDCIAVRDQVFEIETKLSLSIAVRLMDPNMAKQPSSAGSRRGLSWIDEFADAGLHCDLADTSDVGRQRINEYLKPDERTRAPRMTIDLSCTQTINQFKRFVWDDYKKSLEKAQKQTPREMHDDFPAIWRYCMNHNPSYNLYHSGPQILRRKTKRFEPIGRPTRRG